MLAMMVFLELNGEGLSCTDEDIIDTGLRLARDEMDDKGLLEWIRMV
jgi:death-on-curing protein